MKTASGCKNNNNKTNNDNDLLKFNNIQYNKIQNTIINAACHL